MFGKKSKMEKAVALDDDFDLDLDFDEDFSFDFDDGVSAENKKARASRTPIMNATLDVGQGLKKATLSKSGMEAILKGVLPSEYGQFYDNVSGGINDVQMGISDSTSSLGEIKKTLQGTIAHMADIADKKEYSKLAAMLNKVAGDRESEYEYQRQSKEEMRNEEITKTLGELFSVQAKIDNKRSEDNDKKEAAREAMSAVKFKTNMQAMGAMNNNLTRMRMFQERNAFNYYRKSIEIGIRQLYTLTDISAELKQHNNQVLKALNDVKLNTGLPDYVKMQNKETIKQIMKQRATNKVFDGFMSRGSDFFGNLSKNISDTIKYQVSQAMDIMGMATDGVNQVMDFEDQRLDDDSGMMYGDESDVERMANMGASTGLPWLASKAKSRLSKNKYYQKTLKPINWLRKFNSSPGEMILAGLQGQKVQSFMNRFDSPLLGAGFDILTDLVRGATGSAKSIKFDPSTYNDFSGPNGLQNLAQKSMGVVIPGYLSLILRELKIIRTGQDQGTVIFDHKTGKFVNDKEMKTSILKNVVSKDTLDSFSRVGDTVASELGLSERDYRGRAKYLEGFSKNDFDTVGRQLAIAAINGEVIDTEYLTNAKNFSYLGKEKAQLLANKFKEADSKDKDDLENRIINVADSARSAKHLTIDKAQVEGMINAGYGPMLETAGILKNGEATSTGYMKAVQEMAKYQDSQLSYRPTQRDIHQSIVQSLANKGKIKRFASGGYTGDGDKHEIKGAVDAGEYVVTKEEVEALGGKEAFMAWFDKAKEEAKKQKDKLKETKLYQEASSRVNSVYQSTSDKVNQFNADYQSHRKEEMSITDALLASVNSNLESIKLLHVVKATEEADRPSAKARYKLLTRQWMTSLRNSTKSIDNPSTYLRQLKDRIKRSDSWNNIASMIEINGLNNMKVDEEKATKIEDFKKEDGSIDFNKVNMANGVNYLKQKVGNEAFNAAKDAYNSEKVKQWKKAAEARIPKSLRERLTGELGDIYQIGQAEPILYKEALHRGEYRNSKGDIYKTWQDIDDSVYDSNGNMVISYSAFLQCMVRKGKSVIPVTSIPVIASNTRKWIKRGALFTGAMVYGTPFVAAYGAYRLIKATNAHKALGRKIAASVQPDLYLEGQEEPILLGRDISASKYYDVNTKRLITKVEDITGEVIDAKTQQVIMRATDLSKLTLKDGKHFSKFSTASTIRTSLTKMGLKGSSRAVKVASSTAKVAGRGLFRGLKFGFKSGTGILALGARGYLSVYDRMNGKVKSPEEQQELQTAVIEEGNKERRSFFSSVLKHLSDTRRSVFGDKDGDGDRDNGIRDVQQKEEEKKKQKAEDERQYKRDSLLARMIGWAVAGGKGRKSLKDAKKDADSDDKDGGIVSGIVGGISTLVGGAIMSRFPGLAKVGSKIPLVGRMFQGAGAAGSTAAAAGTMAKGAGFLSKATKVGKFLGPLGIAVSGGSAIYNASQGNWGDAAVDAGFALGGAAMTFGAGATVSAIGSALAAIPVVGWVALGVAAAGYGIYRWVTRIKINDNVKARMMIYGLANDESKMKDIVEFERLVTECTEMNGSTPIINETKLNEKSKDIADIFDLEEGDTEGFGRLIQWYRDRFMPTFSKVFKVLRSINPKYTVNDIHDLEGEELLKYLVAIKPAPGQYTSPYMPFPDLPQPESNGDNALAFIQEMIKPLQDKGVGLPPTVNPSQMANAVNQTPETAKPTEEKESWWQKAGKAVLMANPVTGIFMLAKSYLGKFTDSNVTSTQADQPVSNQYQAFNSAYYKALGLNGLDNTERVSILNKVETEAMKSVGMRDGYATFNGKLSELAGYSAPLFGIDPEDQGAMQALIRYLRLRLLPVLLNKVVALYRETGQLKADIAKLRPAVQMNILNEVLNTEYQSEEGNGSIWSFAVSPFGDRLNTDRGTTLVDVEALRKEVESKGYSDAKTRAQDAAQTAAAGRETASLWDKVKAGASKAWDLVKYGPQGLAANLADKAAQYMPDSIKDTWNNTKDTFNNFFGSVTGTQAQMGLAVYSAFRKAGFSDNQARALTAEVGRENSWRADTIFGFHPDPKNNAVNVGMISWQGARGKKLAQYLQQKGLIQNGKLVRSPEALSAQAEFLMDEMKSGNFGASQANKQAMHEFLSNPNIDVERGMDLVGKHFIKWRIDDPKYRPGGIKNRTMFLNKLNSEIDKNPEIKAGNGGPGVTANVNNQLAALEAQRNAIQSSNIPQAQKEKALASIDAASGRLKASQSYASLGGGNALPSKTDGSLAAGNFGMLGSNPLGTGSTGTSKVPYANTSTRSQKAADIASRTARGKSTGQCAKFVRMALQAAGYKFTPNGSAYQYATLGTMEKMGYKQLPNGTPEAKGDVIVWGPIPGHKHGHIQIYDGTTWVSDFKHRRNLSPYGQSKYSRYWHYRDTGGSTSTVNTAPESKMADVIGGSYGQSVSNVRKNAQPTVQQMNQTAKPTTMDESVKASLPKDNSKAIKELTKTVSVDQAFPQKIASEQAYVNKLTNQAYQANNTNSAVDQLQHSIRNLLGMNRQETSAVTASLASTKQARDAYSQRREATNEMMRIDALNGVSNQARNIAQSDAKMKQNVESAQAQQAKLIQTSEAILEENKKQTRVLTDILDYIRNSSNKEAATPEAKVSYKGTIKERKQTVSSPVNLTKAAHS
jgi:hypothetical protein